MSKKIVSSTKPPVWKSPLPTLSIRRKNDFHESTAVGDMVLPSFLNLSGNIEVVWEALEEENCKRIAILSKLN